MKEEEKSERGGIKRTTLSRSVTNDGGRSKLFHSWENLMMQIRPDAQADATRET